MGEARRLAFQVPKGLGICVVQHGGESCGQGLLAMLCLKREIDSFRFRQCCGRRIITGICVSVNVDLVLCGVKHTTGAIM